MIEPNDSYDPRNFDILLTDIDAEDVHESIPRKLNVEYLSDAPNELDETLLELCTVPTSVFSARRRLG